MILNLKRKYTKKSKDNVIEDRVKRKYTKKSKDNVIEDRVKRKYTKKNKENINDVNKPKRKYTKKSKIISYEEIQLTEEQIIEDKKEKEEYINNSIEFYKNFIESETNCKLDRLSKVPYAGDKGYIHKQQISASLEAICNMILAKKYNHYRCNMICSDTQAGKTAVAGNIIFLLKRYDNLRKYIGLDFNNSIYATPMNDIKNKAQISGDLIQYAYSREDNNTLLRKGDIYHNSDMKKNINPSGVVYKNSVVFMDESHLASNINNINNIFLLSYGINLNGTAKMAENNVFLFTISATLYEERISNILYKNKNIINLLTGDGFRGIEYFFKNKLLRPSFYLNNEDNIQKFKYELNTFNKKIGYYIIRISNRIKDIEKLVPDGFDYITYYQKDKKNINYIIDELPPKPTIVFVKDKMKQAFQLRKENVVMMFDRATKINNKNRTHFTTQSFVGRASGYHNFDIIIYTNLDDVTNQISYLKNKNNIPKTKNTTKKYFNNKTINLSQYNFSKYLFSKILLNRDNINEIINIILKKYNIEVLKKYQDNKSIFNGKFFYNKLKKVTYDKYITPAYDAINNTDGKSNIKYLGTYSKLKSKYKNGDHVFALYFDEDNYNVIVAEKLFTNIDKTTYKYGFNQPSKSSYSIDNNLTDINS